MISGEGRRWEKRWKIGNYGKLNRRNSPTNEMGVETKSKTALFYNSPPKEIAKKTLTGALKMMKTMNLNDTENHIKIYFTHAFPVSKGYLMHS